MEIEVIQKQDRELLIEHSKSSYNFTWLGRNEWLMAIIFLIIGCVTVYLFEITGGYIFIIIGIIELIKFPKRNERWANKKIKEKIFDKVITFKIQDKELMISYDDTNLTHSYNDMRQCLISNTGVLFKITFSEYYYISFKSIELKISKTELIPFLKSRFEKGKINIKTTY